MARSLQVYETPEITVTFEPELCRHTGICVRGLHAVFDVSRRRWVDIAAAPAEEIFAQVARCPSGALKSYRPGEFHPPSTAGLIPDAPTGTEGRTA